MDQMVLTIQRWLNETYTGQPGYRRIEERGSERENTLNALLVALQIEIGIPSAEIELETKTGKYSFNEDTIKACPNISAELWKKVLEANGEEEEKKEAIIKLQNLLMILQGGLWCKGINPGVLVPEFNADITKAIKELQEEAGIEKTGVATYLEFRAVLSSEQFKMAKKGKKVIKTIQQTINKEYSSEMQQLISCDGIMDKKMQAVFLFIFEKLNGIISVDCRDTLLPENFGYFNPKLREIAPTIYSGDHNQFVKLLQCVLYCSGHKGVFLNGTYDEETEELVTLLKNSLLIESGSEITGEMWEKILTNRCYHREEARACDTNKSLSYEDAIILKNNGYEIVGRYLNGVYKMTINEINDIFEAGLSIFPIFKAEKATVDYFTANQGTIDARHAFESARSMGIPEGTTIYFTVNCDIKEEDIERTASAYFQGIRSQFAMDRIPYKIGVSATRKVCNKLAIDRMAVSSFVLYMGDEYLCNQMPPNWAFDKFEDMNVGHLQIAKDGYSRLDSGFRELEELEEMIKLTIFEACDTMYSLSRKQAEQLYKEGYRIIGRALNGFEPLNKNEISILNSVGLRIVPIYLSEMTVQNDTYENEQKAELEAEEALHLLDKLGIPAGTTIYFTVNDDNYAGDVSYEVVPYFKSVSDKFKEHSAKYKIGVYGPKNACLEVERIGYAEYSFVQNSYSTKYGNDGYDMPNNWSFNQLKARTIDEMEINEEEFSGKDIGFKVK